MSKNKTRWLWLVLIFLLDFTTGCLLHVTKACFKVTVWVTKQGVKKLGSWED